MESSLDISNNRPLTEEQKSSYITRMKAAWARLPDDKKDGIETDAGRSPPAVRGLCGEENAAGTQISQYSAHEELSDETIGMGSYKLTNSRSKQRRLRSSLGQRVRFLGQENTSSLIRAGNWLREQCGSKICCTSIRFHREHPR